MNNLCEKFHDLLDSEWESRHEITVKVTSHNHLQSCADCQEYLRNFQEIVSSFPVATPPVSVYPDFGTMRVNVWDRIDRQSNRSVIWSNILRPVVLAPAFAIIVLVSVYFILRDSSTNQTSSNKLFTYAVEQLQPNYYPDALADELAATDMSDEIKDYLVQNADYSTIQQVLSDQHEWNEMVEAIAEKQL